MQYKYRVCDICGTKMGVNDYYQIKIDCKSQKASKKNGWKWLDCCDACKEAVEKLLQERAENNQIEFS